jgi:hypothetical protein
MTDQTEKPGYMTGGLKRKYRILKPCPVCKGEMWVVEVPGSFGHACGNCSHMGNATGWVDADPDADYFVLRIDKDPHAQAAAFVYAVSVQADNPQLGEELKALVAQYARKDHD